MAITRFRNVYDKQIAMGRQELRLPSEVCPAHSRWYLTGADVIVATCTEYGVQYKRATCKLGPTLLLLLQYDTKVRSTRIVTPAKARTSTPQLCRPQAKGVNLMGRKFPRDRYPCSCPLRDGTRCRRHGNGSVAPTCMLVTSLTVTAMARPGGVFHTHRPAANRVHSTATHWTIPISVIPSTFPRCVPLFQRMRCLSMP